MASVEGKVIIITGAARGLGRAYATALANEGAKVVAGDIRDSSNTVSEIKSSGGEALAVELDVGDAISCEAMAASAIESYGKIDGIINNAALYGGLESSKADAIPEEDWLRVMDINVSGVWRSCKAVIPHLRSNGGGSIINIASLAAVYGMPNALHYATSKAAVIGMTRSMARELGRSWVRVNAIAPSAVMTEGTEEFFGERLEKAKQIIASGQSLQRNLETEDLIGTVRYLLSDDSKFVTGQTIMVDGGTVFL